jgi:hypothetical protein
MGKTIVTGNPGRIPFPQWARWLFSGSATAFIPS